MFLTKRQRQIYDYIKDFIEEQGYAPSIVEIGENFELTSPATVHKHLQNLVQKGMIKRSWNKSRAIELMPETLVIENNLPEYHLIKHIPNKYPQINLGINNNTTSPSDFYIYEKYA